MNRQGVETGVVLLRLMLQLLLAVARSITMARGMFIIT